MFDFCYLLQDESKAHLTQFSSSDIKCYFSASHVGQVSAKASYRLTGLNLRIVSYCEADGVKTLPLLSKVFERLVHQQVVSFIDSRDLLKDNISGFRKDHSTTTVLIRIRDDIIKAMKRGELGYTHDLRRLLKSICHH